MKPLGTLVFTLVLAGTTAFGQAQTERKLTAADAAAGDQFGLGVALSGDTAIIGSYADDDAGPGSGSAYIFSKVGQDWIQQAKLTASDGAAGDNFGLRVTIDGGTAIAGSPLDDDNGADSGSAYVYTGSGSSWTEQAKLKPGDGSMGDQFGRWSGLDGDTTIICAFLDDTSAGIDAGSAYIFVRSGTTWTEQAKLTPFDPAPADLFARSVSISGSTVVIGSVKDDHGGMVNAGSAYIFVREGSVWSQQAKLTASDAAAGDFFGNSAYIDGNTAVIGANTDDHSGLVDAGSVYIFVRNGTTWTEQAKLIASDAAAGDRFGRSVSIDGDRVLTGVIRDNTAAGIDTGSAYIFERIGTLWSETVKFVAFDAATNDHLGYTVDIKGTNALAGSYLDDHAGGEDAGSAYVLSLLPAPSTYCTAKVNSCGSLPSIASTGTPSASSSSGFTIHASNTKALKSGLLIYTDIGPGNAPFSGGVLCLGTPPLKRSVAIGDTTGTSGQCDGTLSIDMNAFALGALGSSPLASLSVPGTQINCQFWGRDSIASGALLSDALEYFVGD